MKHKLHGVCTTAFCLALFIVWIYRAAFRNEFVVCIPCDDEVPISDRSFCVRDLLLVTIYFIETESFRRSSDRRWLSPQRERDAYTVCHMSLCEGRVGAPLV